jgi:hypothetical protein
MKEKRREREREIRIYVHMEMPTWKCLQLLDMLYRNNLSLVALTLIRRRVTYHVEILPRLKLLC